MSFQMTEEEQKLLSDCVRGYAGLVFSGAQEYLFQKRIKRRMDANKLVSAREYYHFLRFDPRRDDEMRELINLLTVNETYFFRETPQIEMVSRELLPALKERRSREKTVRIWSAACSNGAEPYTLAMLVLESGLFQAGGWKVEIFGTDINSEVVQAARKGMFGVPAFRGTDEALRKKYFTPAGAGQWEIRDEVKKMVKFSQMNLHNRAQMRLMRDMDAIFCRNVLIYFDTEGKREVSEMFHDSLAPSGYLVIGQTESLFKVTTLYTIVPMTNVLLYQKPSAPPGGGK
ncbi:MAG: protein-glutamate O-methyltransferase CheR [Nitrospinae bacterium]|nr:protein-glutamate O-methyltransferase CheR [Nitrospinota bacterium]